MHPMNRKHFLSSLVTLGAVASTSNGLSAAMDPTLGLPHSFPGDLKIPPYLNRGDVIGITASAGFIMPEEVLPAVQQMESWGFRVKSGNTIGKKDFSFGGTDEERAADLQQLIDDDSVKAIM